MHHIDMIVDTCNKIRYSRCEETQKRELENIHDALSKVHPRRRNKVQVWMRFTRDERSQLPRAPVPTKTRHSRSSSSRDRESSGAKRSPMSDYETVCLVAKLFTLSVMVSSLPRKTCDSLGRARFIPESELTKIVEGQDKFEGLRNLMKGESPKNHRPKELSCGSPTRTETCPPGQEGQQNGTAIQEEPREDPVPQDNNLPLDRLNFRCVACPGSCGFRLVASLPDSNPGACLLLLKYSEVGEYQCHVMCEIVNCSSKETGNCKFELKWRRDLSNKNVPSVCQLASNEDWLVAKSSSEWMFCTGR